MLVTKKGDLKTLIGGEVFDRALVMFRADWQHRQFIVMRGATPFPMVTVCMVMDFAENFTCQYQGDSKVQAAHWHHEQVTVHPTVSYYRLVEYYNYYTVLLGLFNEVLGFMLKNVVG